MLRWHVLSLGNALKVIWINNPIRSAFVAAGALFFLAYNVAGVWVSLADSAVPIREHWLSVAAGSLAAAASAGGICGRVTGRWASSRVQAPWLAVLPWPATARVRSARWAALAVGALLALLIAFVGWGACEAVAGPHPVFVGVVSGFAFAAPFALAVTLAGDAASLAERATARSTERTRLSWMRRVTAALDQMTPRWIGLWAQADGMRLLSLWWVGSLAVAAVAGVVAVERSWLLPSVVTAIVGGNLAYMVGLRGAPLLSPILRASPVGFGAVWLGLTRLPLALSLAWFGIAALPVLWVSANGGGEALAALLLLLLLNLLFSTAVAVRPASRRQAAVLHGFGLFVIAYQGLQYGWAYAALAGVVMLGLVALLWRQARRRFHIRG